MRTAFLTILFTVAAMVPFTGGAAIVYVDDDVPAWTGAGTSGSPYGTIQQAYAALWGTAGDHEIRLLPGYYYGQAIGANPYGDIFGG